jgi:putative ABC transport system permease protein
LIAEVNVIGGEYLQALGVHLIAGRWFREEEMKHSSDTAILNSALAQRFWPTIISAIGKQICIYCTPENPNNWKRVIGVVSSVRHADLDAAPGYNAYLGGGALESAAFIVVRTDRPSGEIGNAIRRTIAKVDPDQPVLLSTSMRALLADSIADRRFITSLLTATGCLALILSAAGVYGVTAYTTSRRTQEIGVRMALGATPGKVHALIFHQSFWSVAISLISGLALTTVAMQILRGMITGLASGNVISIWIAAGVVSLTAAVACWVPARRATNVDPMCALRNE